MTEKVKNMLDFFQDRGYRIKRDPNVIDVTEKAKDLELDEVQLLRLSESVDNETAILYPDDIFGFNSSRKNFPLDRTPRRERWIPSNNTPNYSFLIDNGFDAVRKDLSKRKKDADEIALRLYGIMEKELDCLARLCEKYRLEAEERGVTELAEALSNIPHKPARSLYEACLFQKLIIYGFRATKHPHMTLGRFDQYMYKYYKMDVERGVSREKLLEIIELYFLALNLDTDMYLGMQQGDNGQSMVLGGFDIDGNYLFNELSSLCMDASLELAVIDPKINIRVGKNTPDYIYDYGTRLTKRGLGFPQYCNDDVIIPGLVKLGIDEKDAYEYTVAACWEAIIPNCSMDIPNVRTFNFPLVVNNAIHESLEKSETFEELLLAVDVAIAKEAENVMESCRGRERIGYGKPLEPSPFMSIVVDGCIEKGRDICDFSAKYYNLGCHGAGIANAADALAAVKKVIYDERSIDKKTLLKALDNNFEGMTEIRNKLLSCPKVGNDDDYADDVMIRIMKSFSDSLNGKPTGTGGIWRAGTGSAMEYYLSARHCPATADGRLAYSVYSCSYSPSLTAKLNGPLSVITSFTKPDLVNTVNGGPLTMEIHDNVFRNDEGEKKVAQLVKLFVMRGGHQLQLNSLNKETLLDARENPDKYPNLIVRVWGWSGYFRELDTVYQDHVISRTDFRV
ncbi:MAG: pyruvate formate-lyase [Clostridia bacterium]|nr:pyruvate formate-lyase [Clostridia bacterium]